MRAIVTKQEFVSCIQRTQNIVEKKTTMPILGNVLLGASEDTGLKISATDLEVGIVQSCHAKVEAKGNCTVGARKLFEVVRELPDKEITLLAADNVLEVLSEPSIFHLRALPAEDFPTLPKFESSDFMNIPSAVLKDMVRKTIASVSTDETRYNLNGVLTQLDERRGKSILRMVSTDGHRLSLCERELSEKTILPDLMSKDKHSLDRRDVILPRKGVVEIGKLVDDGEGGIDFGIDKANVMIRKADISIIMRLIEGNFPDYRSVIPTQKGVIVTISAQPLVESLRRMSILAAERSKGVQFSFKNGQLTLSSNNPDFGDAQDTVPVSYEGEETRIGFNARYLLDMLQLVEGDVSLELCGELRPCVVRAKEDPDFLYVLMPMRI